MLLSRRSPFMIDIKHLNWRCIIMQQAQTCIDATVMRHSHRHRSSHSHTEGISKGNKREKGYFRTMCRLALLFSKQIQTVSSCFLIEASSLCQILEMLQPHNQCFSSYRKLLVTAMCLPAMWKGWLGACSPIIGSSFISPES